MCSVHFGSEEVVTIPSKHDVAARVKDINTTWYKVEELIKIRDDARALTKEIQYLEQVHKAESEVNFSVRGLELYFDVDRRKRKFYVQRIILAAQRSLNDVDLALVSTKLTRCSRDRAIEYARLDAEAATTP